LARGEQSHVWRVRGATSGQAQRIRHRESSRLLGGRHTVGRCRTASSGQPGAGQAARPPSSWRRARQRALIPGPARPSLSKHQIGALLRLVAPAADRSRASIGPSVLIRLLVRTSRPCCLQGPGANGPPPPARASGVARDQPQRDSLWVIVRQGQQGIGGAGKQRGDTSPLHRANHHPRPAATSAPPDRRAAARQARTNAAASAPPSGQQQPATGLLRGVSSGGAGIAAAYSVCRPVAPPG